MQTILKVENLSKQYRLGLVGTGSIGHDLNRFWHRIRGKEDPYLTVGALNQRDQHATQDYVWALQDINFSVAPGEVFGIIGKNGAGKSTLLKLLSRVTGPTTGVIKSRGRIASLLEVGTGFHPELTGRENIFLNGAILGMTKSEIKSKLEEIITFSGCEMYIDTPVKRYSSGMTVRLAFAVAAHLEPDILVIDEVLAVGDAEFQKKAIGKMQDISKSDGRTVLFVSHNMAAVKSLCTRAIVLEHGKVAFEGGTDNAVNFYLQSSGSALGLGIKKYSPEHFADQQLVTVAYIQVNGKGQAPDEPIEQTTAVQFTVGIHKLTPEAVNIVLRFKDQQGNFIFVSHNTVSLADLTGKHDLQMTIPEHFFNEGVFYLDLLVSHNKKVLFLDEDALDFTVIQEAKSLGQWMGTTKGPLKPKFNWTSVAHV